MDWKQKYPEWVTKSGGLNSVAPAVVKQDVFILRCKERHGDTYIYDKSKYVAALSKVIITCKIHGDFEQTPAKHINVGQGCPVCAGTLLKTNEQFILDAKKVHGDSYYYANTKYINDSSKVQITCKIHGDFMQTASDHLQGTGCRACFGTVKKTTSIFVQQATEVHRGKYTYDNAEYLNDFTKLLITCRHHGDFKQSPSSHLQGAGCPLCAGNVKRTTAQFIQEAKLVHGDTYNYDLTEYKNNHTKLTVYCKIHGNFDIIPHSHLDGQGCQGCSVKQPMIIVYIITEGSNYKIGICSILKRRILNLEKSSALSLRLIASKVCSTEQQSRALEKLLHSLPYKNPYYDERFDGYTEWRTIPKQDLEALILEHGFTQGFSKYE